MKAAQKRRGGVFAFTSPWHDKERTSLMKGNGKLAKTTQPSKNGSAGQQKNGKELPTSVSFSDLNSSLQRLLVTRAPNPEYLDDIEVKHFWAEYVCPSAPELAALNVSAMRRVMQSAVTQRRKKTNPRGVLANAVSL